MDRDIISRMNHTHHLKKVIMELFPESIGFFKTGRHIIVYSQFTNPCAYSVSSLRGSGMRDKSLCIFSKYPEGFWYERQILVHIQ